MMIVYFLEIEKRMVYNGDVTNHIDDSLFHRNERFLNIVGPDSINPFLFTSYEFVF